MQTDPVILYHHEWDTLQNQFDSYEKFSLIIKLVSIALFCLLCLALHIHLWSIPILGVLWLQDGIWKTFQERIAQRILVIEEAIHKNLAGIYHPEAVPLQFNRSWLMQRPSTKGLIKEYIHQALKPTVAYPHMLLIILSIVFFVLNVG